MENPNIDFSGAMPWVEALDVSSATLVRRGPTQVTLLALEQAQVQVLFLAQLLECQGWFLASNSLSKGQLKNSQVHFITIRIAGKFLDII